MDNVNTAITLTFEGINGESQIERNALDILEWGWSITNPTTRHGTGLSAGTPTISEIHFSKISCSGSPIIMQYVAEGKHFPKATLKMRKTTGQGESQVFYTLELSKVFVTNFSTGGAGHSVDMHESFAISFQTVGSKYKPQATENGNVGAEISFGYDVVQKKIV